MSRDVPGYLVVPAKAGNHTPCLINEERSVSDLQSSRPPVVMGPCFRRDDIGRFNGKNIT